MLSRAAVVPGLEQAEEWESHREGVLQSLAPVGHLEAHLAERAALLLWRLSRVARYERERIALGQETAEEDLAEKRRFSLRAPELLKHYETIDELVQPEIRRAIRFLPGQ